MTASKKVIQFERKNSGWIKPAVIALCLIAAGFGAITVAEVAATRQHRSPVSAAPESAFGTTGSPTPMQATVRVNDESGDAGSAPRASGDAASTPRECQPYEGVNHECTFN